jgi:hypothetical protein
MDVLAEAMHMLTREALLLQSKQDTPREIDFRPALNEQRRFIKKFTSRARRDRLNIKRGGSKARCNLQDLKSYYSMLHPIVRQAKLIYRQNRIRNWKAMVLAAFPDLPEDLIARLCDPPDLPDPLMKALAEKGGTSKPSDIALEAAARCCGAPPYSYSLSYLKGSMSNRNGRIQKVDSNLIRISSKW